MEVNIQISMEFLHCRGEGGSYPPYDST